MSLFNNPRGGMEPPDDSIPVSVLDLSKRYDLYCSTHGEDRLYENVQIVGIRTFEKKKHEYATALIGGYLELESPNGTRMMIPHLRIYLICEHGAEPAYKVLRKCKTDED
jgi:hypothetical protein